MPTPRCVIATAAASLVRTAFKTIPGWEVWLPTIRRAAREHLPASLALSPTQPRFSPQYWGCPSFAENLHNASRGTSVSLGVLDTQTFQNLVNPLCKSVQAKFYKALINARFQPCSTSELQPYLAS